ncbi:MAG: hypothetical protein ACYC7D_00520 [Nitrososphaerales archaeon]
MRKQRKINQSKRSVVAGGRIAGVVVLDPPRRLSEAGGNPLGMKRALESAIGLPSGSTSASWILGLKMPQEVSRNFMMSLLLYRYRENWERQG